MKKLNEIKFYGVIAFVIVMFARSVNVFSQTIVEEKLSQHPKAVFDLENGIQSDNEGLRKSSIYFAGKYQIKEVVTALINQIDKEKNPSVRILIANSLYKIGDERGIEKIVSVSFKDSNQKVRRICTALVKEYNSSLHAEKF